MHYSTWPMFSQANIHFSEGGNIIWGSARQNTRVFCLKFPEITIRSIANRFFLICRAEISGKLESIKGFREVKMSIWLKNKKTSWSFPNFFRGTAVKFLRKILPLTNACYQSFIFFQSKRRPLVFGKPQMIQLHLTVSNSFWYKKKDFYKIKFVTSSIKY